MYDYFSRRSKKKRRTSDDSLHTCPDEDARLQQPNADSETTYQVLKNQKLYMSKVVNLAHLDRVLLDSIRERIQHAQDPEHESNPIEDSVSPMDFSFIFIFRPRANAYAAVNRMS